MAKIDYVMAHRRKSGSGAALAAALGVPCISPKFRPKGGWCKKNPRVLNYGVGGFIKYADEVEFVNMPMSVYAAVRKDITFKRIGDIAVPQTKNRGDVYGWIGNGYAVYARNLIASSKGNGIEVYDPAGCASPFTVTEFEDFGKEAKVYTRSPGKLSNTREYRVHVVNGQVVDHALKKKMGKEKRDNAGIEAVNPYVRSHDNGWVFTKKDVLLPELVIHRARMAVEMLELDFGAVDVLYDKYSGRGYVLEVNTAPGLDAPSTLEAYVSAFSN